MKQTLTPVPKDVLTWICSNMTQSSWIVLDTETTGLPGEIVDLAIIDSRGEVVFDSLLRPMIRIPEEATRVHGITDEDVSDAPLFPEKWPEIQSLLVNKRIITYNAKFDRNCLIFTANKHRIDLGYMEWECLMLAYATYRGEPNEYGSPRWHKLGDACAHHGIEIVHAHRAIGDAWAAYQLMKMIAKQHSSR